MFEFWGGFAPLFGYAEFTPQSIFGKMMSGVNNWGC